MRRSIFYLVKAPKALARCTQEGERITERITNTVAQADCSDSTREEILIVQTVLLILLSLFNFSFPSRVMVIVIKFIFPFYKNIQAEVDQNFKNILRTYPGGESLYFALFTWKV